MSSKINYNGSDGAGCARARKTLAPLNDDLALLDSGLDSLGIAVLVARLEDRLGVDPFTSSDDVQFPVTIGDFVRAYENGAR